MRRLSTWLWKEWRDHRALLIGIAVALPVLTAGAFVAFPDRLGDAVLRSRQPVVEVVSAAEVSVAFVALAAAVALLALAADLFGGEMQRGTLDLVRRTPRGLGLAFAAKVTFLVGAIAAVMAWELLAITVAWGLSGRAPAIDVALRALDRPDLGTILLVASALGLWFAAVSTWIPRSAAAVGAALLLLGVLALPAVWMLIGYPTVVRWLIPAILPRVFVGIGALGLVTAAVSFLRGLRLRRGPWSAAWRGLALVLVVATAGYAYGATRLAEYLDFRPGERDVWMSEGYLGRGEKVLYVNAWRGARQYSGWGAADPSTPVRAFAVDLATGTSKPLGPTGSWCDRVPGAQSFSMQGGQWALEPVPVLVCRTFTEDYVSAVAYYDGASGALRRTVPPSFYPSDVVGWLREGLSATTRVRDEQGRRVWLRPVDEMGNAVIEGEERLAPDRPKPESLLQRSVWDVPQGWYGLAPKDAKGRRFLDATTGNASFATMPGWGKALSPRRWLRREDRPKRPTTGTWLVGDVATGAESPALRTPDEVSEPLDVDLVLGRRVADGESRFVLWNPVTGEDQPIAWSGEPLAPIGSTIVMGRRADTGVCLLTLTRRSVGGDLNALALLDVRARTVRALTSWAGSLFVEQPIALTDDGALIGIVNSHRIVRLGPERDHRDVLVPREEHLNR